MSKLNVNFADVQERCAVPKGRYELQITDAGEQETGENSKRPGSPMIRFILGFTDLSLNASMIYHYVSLPHPEEDSESAKKKILALLRFLVLFNIPHDDNELDISELCRDALGCSAMVEVSLEFRKKKEVLPTGETLYVDDFTEQRNVLIVPKLSQGIKHPPVPR